MKNPKRQKASKHEDDDVDFISNMPDHILVSILSHIQSTEEVIRTSILSRRWRHLWTAIPSLDIIYRDIRYGGQFTKIEFLEFVYWILSSRTADLDEFHLCCSNNYSMSTVWRWINMAVTRNVKKLNLSCSTKEKTEAIELPHCLVSCGSLEVLRLEHLGKIGLSLPTFVGFPALRVLDLTDADLREKDLVKDFLKSCPLLEELSLFICMIGELVCISCPKLKRLRILNYEDEGSHGIKLSCPELADLDIGLSISEDITDPVPFHGISHFKPSWMHLYFSIETIDAACVPTLSNLKTLVLNTTFDAFTIDELVRFLKYCPKLEYLRLSISKDVDEESESVDEAETRRIWTPDMKRVEFFEVNGEKPKLVIDSLEDVLELNFTWGNKVKFSHW